MPRVKRGVQHVKRRKSLMERVKGFQDGRKNLIKLAKIADTKAGVYAYVGRKNKKRNMRGLWQVKINAAARSFGISYSKFIGALKAKNIGIDRKILAKLAENNPEIFKKIAELAK